MSLRILDRDDPRPMLGDTIYIVCRDLKDRDRNVYDLSGVSKWYCTVKSDLTVADASAQIHIDSATNPTQFVLTSAATGKITVILSPTNSAALTAGTFYYLQLKGIYASGEMVSVVYEPEFMVVERVVKSTT